MLPTVINYLNQLQTRIQSTIGSRLDYLVNQVALAYLPAIRDIIFSAPLIYLKPNLFHIGLITGFVFPKYSQEIVNDVGHLLQDDPSTDKMKKIRNMVARIVPIALFYLWFQQGFILAATGYFSIKWGAKLRATAIELGPRRYNTWNTN